MIFRKDLGSCVSVESLEDLVDLAADNLFNVLAWWSVVGSVGEGGDDCALDIADVAGGGEGGESSGLKGVKKRQQDGFLPRGCHEVGTFFVVEQEPWWPYLELA